MVDVQQVQPEQRQRVRAVIAGNYHQFVSWCRDQGISPGRHDVLYATPERLRGRNDVEVLRVGTWYERDDLREIEDVLRFVNRFAELGRSVPVGQNSGFHSGS